MKSSILVLALWLGANSWAQTSPQRRMDTPVAAKAGVVNAPPPLNARVQSGKASGKPPSSPVKPAAVKPATKAPAKFTAQSSRQRRGRRRAAQPHSAKTAVAAARKPGLSKAQRDPFVSPVVERVRGHSEPCAGTGRQCLLVAGISLHGVVRSPGGFIAVVVNGEHTYFLRENDPLADGAVERITNDAITLRERSSDFLGRPVTREVTKKVGALAKADTAE